MLLAIMIVGSIIAYAALGGFIGVKSLQISSSRCNRCARDIHCSKDHEFAACIMGMLWPVALPLAAGMLAASREPKAIRVERKRLELQKTIRDLERELGL